MSTLACLSVRDVGLCVCVCVCVRGYVCVCVCVWLGLPSWDASMALNQQNVCLES